MSDPTNDPAASPRSGGAAVTVNPADALLRQGDLEGARGVLVEAIRRDPGDVPARLYLFQLMAVVGEWDKAAKHLGTLAQLSPEAQMLAVVYNQAIAAEREREAVFAGSATAHVHGSADWATQVAEAIRLDATGAHDQAAELRDAAFGAAPDTPGTLDGTRFDWIADADPRFGPCMEAIVFGRYGLLPFSEIAGLKSEGPRDLRDVIWYPAEVSLRTGTSVAALLPARYPGVDGDAARMARTTEWNDDGTGVGQRIWATSNDSEHELLSVRQLSFD
jgi:type VI secretion system protein ImpE